MPSKLIRLQDDILVEVEIPGRESVAISGGVADKVGTAMDAMAPILLKACKPVIAVWKSLSTEVTIDLAEIEFGISFEGEGNIYISKAKAGANLTVKFTLKPQ